MDQPLDSGFRRKRAVVRLAAFSSVLALTVAALVGFRSFLSPKVYRDSIRTATVRLGPIEQTITASAIVVPQFDEILSSPIETRVLKILKRPGDFVKKGDSIVRLDTSKIQLAIDNLHEQISLKENELVAAELDKELSLVELYSRRDLKEIDKESTEAALQRIGKLVEDGLGASAELLEARLNTRRAAVEFEQIDKSIANLERSVDTVIERIELETSMLRKETTEQLRLLELATTRSPRDGVLTWVVEVEGMSVRLGDQLARIADLTTFKVEATLSDVYSPRLQRGLPVRLRVNEVMLEGELAKVLPAIDEGTISVIILLAKPSYAGLRSNLRVDAHIVTDAADSTLVVKSGPAFNGSGYQTIYVIRDGSAHRTEAQIGLVGFDLVEITEGVVEGDEIIISNMKNYEHLSTVEVYGN